MTEESLIYRLEKRAEIRREITTRKSVQEGKPDHIANLLEEAAAEINRLTIELDELDVDAVAVYREMCERGYVIRETVQAMAEANTLTILQAEVMRMDTVFSPKESTSE